MIVKTNSNRRVTSTEVGQLMIQVGQYGGAVCLDENNWDEVTLISQSPQELVDFIVIAKLSLDTALTQTSTPTSYTPEQLQKLKDKIGSLWEIEDE